MTHAHDRTMLARLGFADPDKKNPLHDLACQYLAKPENAERLAEIVSPLSKHKTTSCEYSGNRYARWSGIYRKVATRMEVPLVKGSGQYASTIGFLDVELVCQFRGLLTIVPRPGATAWNADTKRSEPAKESVEGDSWENEERVIVEVKAAPCDAGELLRQLGLYQQYYLCGGYITHCVAAVAFDVTDNFRDTLKAHDVHVVRLGAAFAKWAEQARASAPAVVEEV